MVKAKPSKRPVSSTRGPDVRAPGKLKERGPRAKAKQAGYTELAWLAAIRTLQSCAGARRANANAA